MDFSQFMFGISFFTISATFVLFFTISFCILRGIGAKRRQNTVAFFHPNCNDCGGGERVLWMAVKSLQEKGFNIAIFHCCEETGTNILEKAMNRFGIQIGEVQFITIGQRHIIDPASYPFMTMVGQSIGSILLVFKALFQLIPAIFIDTTGFAFTYPFVWLFGSKIITYTHYPTISDDMISKNQLNRKIGWMKYIYYVLLSLLYSFVGIFIDVAITNSSWTYGHISSFWGSLKSCVVFPPVNVDGMKGVSLQKSEQHSIISVGQFRPEKDHLKQLRVLKMVVEDFPDARLLLVGACRNEEDRDRVNYLKSQAETLGIESNVEFHLNVTYSELLHLLSRAKIGLHTMWQEHFGICVVELQAAGCVPVANNTAGPKQDIVVSFNDMPTGELAQQPEEYYSSIKTLLELPSAEYRRLQETARLSTNRFSDEMFETNFIGAIQWLLKQ